jgi:hypothetical protein
MRILFDASVPRPLRRHLPGSDIRTAQEEGWGTLQNGDLLRAAEAKFDVFITADRKLKYQQNLSGRTLAIIVLPGNHLPAVLALAPRIQLELGKIRPGDFVEIIPF